MTIKKFVANNEITVGSVVTVERPGLIYTSYTEFAEKSGYPDAVINSNCVIETDKLLLKAGTEGTVIFEAPHPLAKDLVTICVIEGEFGRRLFSKNGLKPKKSTKHKK